MSPSAALEAADQPTNLRYPDGTAPDQQHLRERGAHLGHAPWNCDSSDVDSCTSSGGGSRSSTRSAIELATRAGPYAKRSMSPTEVEPGEHEHRVHPGFQSGNDVGVHSVTDHGGCLGVGLERVQCRAHHQRVGLADVVRRSIGGPGDERGDGTGRWHRPVGGWPGGVGIRGDEPCTA